VFPSAGVILPNLNHHCARTLSPPVINLRIDTSWSPALDDLVFESNLGMTSSTSLISPDTAPLNSLFNVDRELVSLLGEVELLGRKLQPDGNKLRGQFYNSSQVCCEIERCMPLDSASAETEDTIDWRGIRVFTKF